MGQLNALTVARASLQATGLDQILIAQDMFQLADKNIAVIKFFFLIESAIHENAVKFDLEHHFSGTTTIPGTRSHHSFLPVSHIGIEIKRISAREISAIWLSQDLKQMRSRSLI